MTEVRDPESIIEAAQKAAGDGDYPAAERLLREAAAIQEASLGGTHPDLAITLNNLAFVCERTDKFDDAERCYRRAHAIAVASLSPGHPFIKTSLSNLVEFCASRGIAIWTPPAVPVDDPPLDDDATETDFAPETPAPAPEIQKSEIEQPPVLVRRVQPRTIAAAAAIAATIVVVLVARHVTTDTPVSAPQPRQEPAPVAREPVHTAPAIAPDPPKAAIKESPPAPAPERRPLASSTGRPLGAVARSAEVAATSPASVTVLTAHLCGSLARRGSPDWQCTPVENAARPGTFIFYTRLAANARTTVEHRWYRDGRLHQAMRLSIPATPGNGYRTFSSNRVSAERVGEWKVELRTRDGSVLHEETFVVR